MKQQMSSRGNSFAVFFVYLLKVFYQVELCALLYHRDCTLYALGAELAYVLLAVYESPKVFSYREHALAFNHQQTQYLLVALVEHIVGLPHRWYLGLVIMIIGK